MIENTAEITNIDTRYESFRLPDKKREKDLLDYICENGIKEPLQGVRKDQLFIVLDGFKRLRAARKLKISVIPIEIMASSEKEGILELLKISNSKSLHILEQVKLVNDLNQVHGMATKDIACHLKKSNAWVCVRLGILTEFSSEVWQAVFRGDFPASNAIYTLRQFRRLNKESKQSIDEFVKVVSGKGLKHREIESLANGWFKGGEKIKEQIRHGDLSWSIKNMDTNTHHDLGENERRLINDLEIVGKYMGRIVSKAMVLPNLSSPCQAMAKTLSGGILDKQKNFTETLQFLIQGQGHD